MLQLAGRTHQWFATFYSGDSYAQLSTEILLETRARLRQKVEGFTPVAETSNHEAEAMYECCRWASLVMLAVEKLCVPIHTAARQVRIQPRLTRRLRMTDLSNLWGKHKGLLFWVTSVCHFATTGQCFPLLATTIFARFSQELAMSDHCLEIAIKPLRKLKHFESLCCQPELVTRNVAT